MSVMELSAEETKKRRGNSLDLRQVVQDVDPSRSAELDSRNVVVDTGDDVL